MVQSLRGFRDIIYPETKKFTQFENTAREIMELFGYREIRIPVLEQRELFVKSTGETSDIVSKEMYTFTDAGGRNIALRPEATPGIIRAYLENKLGAKQQVQKLFFIGDMFRSERPQKGRYRQFGQIDVEYIGNGHPSADGEVIILLDNIFKKAQVLKYSIEINSLGCPKCRPKYRKELLNFLLKNKKDLCENCSVRIEKNPMRALDCKIDKFKVAEKAPKLVLCPECDTHFAQVKEFLTGAKLKFTVNTNMVRGLDYYTRTVFEFKSKEIGAHDALAGGGRYDSLIKSMGGADIPSIGWALGVERVLSAIKKEPKTAKPLAFVIAADIKSQKNAFVLMQNLIKNQIKTEGGFFGQSLKSQMRSADKSGAEYAVIIGEKELENKSVTLKNLRDGTQQEMKEIKLVEFFKKEK
jgi:histidyl-tRNA synthetase